MGRHIDCDKDGNGGRLSIAFSPIQFLPHPTANLLYSENNIEGGENAMQKMRENYREDGNIPHIVFYDRVNQPWDTLSGHATRCFRKNKTYEQIYGEKRAKEIKKKLHKKLCERKNKGGGFERGKNHWNWRGGKGQYPPEFNHELKSQIRARDNYHCQLCNKKEGNVYSLDIHHIDYNKMNSSSINLIALCKNCHTKTQSDRGAWAKYFQDLMNIFTA